MKKALYLVLLVFSAALQAGAVIVPAPPDIAATGYLLEDFHSGRVLVENNAGDRMEPASLTKMMLTYVVSNEIKGGNIKIDDKVRVSKKAWRAPGSRMFIEVNTQVSVEDLMKGVIVQSGNDASIALAEYVAGSEEAFASIMNEYARVLGMTGTHFVNSTGLPHAEHYTTPRDMARLARALIKDFPEHYAWYALEKFTYNDITQSNRNRLLWRDKYVDGIKTGHTKSAGYCLVASALRDGMRLISVIMGSDSEDARERASQQLLAYGFRFYETRQLYGAEHPLRDMRVWKGRSNTVPIGFTESLHVTVPRGRMGDLETVLSFDKTVTAPVTRGDVYGTVRVTLEGEPVIERPVIALANVDEGSWWKRLIDAIQLFFRNLFT
jgi:D-alanyl-D-alanine carboxypeptidase (penicillin-binding protein 5/6)